MTNIWSKLVFVLYIALFLFPAQSQAYFESQWYIKDFQSEIEINKDSSLLITENITADCPNCFDKHGIFRILPTRYSPVKNKYVSLPTKLISLTNENDQPIKYQEIRNYFDRTITWKIGDPDRTVRGVNHYKIKYQVKNTIRLENLDFDEFYWNLSGNQWDMPIDNFQAKVILPTGLGRDKVKETNLYSGFQNESGNEFAELSWQDEQTLLVKTNRSFNTGEGITLSLTFPKSFFTPSPFSLSDLPFNFTYLVLPLLVLLICIILWVYFGNDPNINPTVAPEFAPPEKLKPITMGLALTDGQLRNDFISAAIIDLAVQGVLKIEEVEGKGLFKKKDYQISLIKPDPQLTLSEKRLIDGLKLNQTTPSIFISELKNKFYSELPSITKDGVEELQAKKFIQPRSRKMQRTLFTIGILIGASGLWFGGNAPLIISLIISGLILIIFSFLMLQRTREGAILLRQIRGFRLFLDKAEKYRQRFFEQQNMFETFLPYAIMFGLTKKWIEKMKLIYGQEYFNSYHPVWYSSHFSSFDVSNVDSMISGMSETISSTLSSSPSGSGSSGGGFSGGGGGGGGGGGW